MKRPRTILASTSAAVLTMALLVATIPNIALAQRAANLVINWTIVLRAAWDQFAYSNGG